MSGRLSIEEQVRADFLAYAGRPLIIPGLFHQEETYEVDDGCSDMDISDDEGNDGESEKAESEDKDDDAVVKQEERSDEALVARYIREPPTQESDAAATTGGSEHVSTSSTDSARSETPSTSVDAGRPDAGPFEFADTGKLESPPDSSASASTSRTLIRDRRTPPTVLSSPAPDGNPDYFVCNLQGCGEILPKDFFVVRSHIRNSPNHLGMYRQAVNIYPCPVWNCNFESESGMRVAEHVCSDKHLNVKIRCFGRKCDASFNGRLYSFKRHRSGENGRVCCRSCEGCDLVFDTGEERILHETHHCPGAAAARHERAKRKADEELQYRRAKKRRVNRQTRRKGEGSGSGSGGAHASAAPIGNS